MRQLCNFDICPFSSIIVISAENRGRGGGSWQTGAHVSSLSPSYLQRARLQHRSQKYLGVSSRTHAGAPVRTLRAFIYNSMLKKSDSMSRIAHTSPPPPPLLPSSSSLSFLSFYERRGKNAWRTSGLHELQKSGLTPRKSRLEIRNSRSHYPSLAAFLLHHFVSCPLALPIPPPRSLTPCPCRILFSFRPLCSFLSIFLVRMLFVPLSLPHIHRSPFLPSSLFFIIPSLLPHLSLF